MKKSKNERLESAGWKVGRIADFLNLPTHELVLIDTKQALIKFLREERNSKQITQKQLAEMINSSQSRVAKLEAASPNVSLDLVFRALFALGVSREKVGRVISIGKCGSNSQKIFLKKQ